MEEKRPFDGLKVLDFTWGGVGPFQANFLAYYGATVIRIESFSRPDVTRQHGNVNPRPDSPNADKFNDPRERLNFGPAFAVTHPVKKYGISLNLNNTEAVEIFKKKNIDYIPVLEKEDGHTLVGQLEYRKLMDFISKEVLLRQQELEV